MLFQYWRDKGRICPELCASVAIPERSVVLCDDYADKIISECVIVLFL